MPNNAAVATPENLKPELSLRRELRRRLLALPYRAFLQVAVHLLTRLPRPDGLDAYAPGRQVVGREEAPEPSTQSKAVPPPVAGKEAVIAQSRTRYAKTREEVEAQIATMMGWGPPAFAGDDPAVAEGKKRAFKAMTDAGIPREQALDLLARFDLGDVEKQLAWLPSRNAKNPARFLAAAIEGAYDAPLALRRHSGQGEIKQGETGHGENAQDEAEAAETSSTS